MEEKNEKEEIWSKRVRAGKRTYFFDIKSTRSGDYYLTMTESKKRFKEDGFFYEKHKIFLYKEDFKKFVDALNETFDHIKTELLPDYDFDKEFEPTYSNDNREGDSTFSSENKPSESTSDEGPVAEESVEPADSSSSELKWE